MRTRKAFLGVGGIAAAIALVVGCSGGASTDGTSGSSGAASSSSSGAPSDGGASSSSSSASSSGGSTSSSGGSSSGGSTSGGSTSSSSGGSSSGGTDGGSSSGGTDGGVTVKWGAGCWYKDSSGKRYQAMPFKLQTPAPIPLEATLFYNTTCSPAQGTDNLNDTGGTTPSGSWEFWFIHHPDETATSAIWSLAGITSGCIDYSKLPNCP